MRFILGFLTVLGFLLGALVWLSAKSAIHEILGTLMIGFACLMVGITSIVNELTKLDAYIKQQSNPPLVSRQLGSALVKLDKQA